MVTDVSEEQYSKAEFPIEMTESGMVIDVSDRHLNAKSPIATTE
jgi:hypothetical protein